MDKRPDSLRLAGWWAGEAELCRGGEVLQWFQGGVAELVLLKDVIINISEALDKEKYLHERIRALCLTLYNVQEVVTILPC